MMTSKVRAILLIAIGAVLQTAGVAAAPYEGSWCEDGDQILDISGKTLTDLERAGEGPSQSNGDCHIEQVTNMGRAWRLNVRCHHGERTTYTLSVDANGSKARVSSSAPGFEPYDVKRCPR